MLDLRVIGLLLALAVGIAGWIATCAAWRFDQVAAGVRPLDPREFERLAVVTVGTGGAYENPARRGPATAVGLRSQVVLVDVGRSVAEGLRNAEIPVSQPGLVLLTNLLPENTLGLDDLLLTGWIEGRREPLRLLGPEGTEELARRVEAAAQRGVDAWARAMDASPPPRFDARDIGDGFAETRGGLSLRAAALPGGPTPALAYRFEANGRSAVVSATGWGADALTAFAQGAQLLVHQAVDVPTPEQAKQLGLDEDPQRLLREAAMHTSFEQVGAIARRAGVGTLVLVRLRPPPVYDIQVSMEIDDYFGGRVQVANDGDAWNP